MTPAARIAAAIGIIDEILTGAAAEKSLLRWSRASRFAGSGDRAAIRDLVFEVLRRRNSLASFGGALTGRGLLIGLLRARGDDPAEYFTGKGYAPPRLQDAELCPAGPDVQDIPEWIGPLWRQSLGQDADRIAEAMRHRAPVWLRLNSTRASLEQAQKMLADDGIETAGVAKLATALRVITGERRLNNSRACQQGIVELQDLSVQLACAQVPVCRGDRVLDYCAGGGGKSLALAAIMPDAHYIAHDADPARMADLTVRAARAGARIQQQDKPAGRFQVVIADVPCSGSGTWRRTPDAKWRLDPAALDELRSQQADILDTAAGYVEKGGYLVYMTCSFLWCENEGIINDFAARNPSFTEAFRKRWGPLDASDGFFISLLRGD